MSEDLTLDAFASETSSEDADANEQMEDSGDRDEAHEEDRSAGVCDVRPVSPISIYDPDGLQCAGCSETVERLFKTDGKRRCRDCTAWQSSPEADGA